MVDFFQKVDPILNLMVLPTIDNQPCMQISCDRLTGQQAINPFTLNAMILL